MKRFLALPLLALATACGGGGSSTPDAQDHDAEVTPDASPSCVATTFGAQDPLVLSTQVARWGGPATPDLGDGGEVLYFIEFWSGIEDSLVGTFDLAEGVQANYETCAICFLVISLDAKGDLARVFFQSGGSVTLTEDPLTGVMAGSVTDLRLVEVTVDPDTAETTPVIGGACLDHDALTLDANQVPPTWTCEEDAFTDGTNCDCECGAVDPDCGDVEAPVVGCDKGEVCSNDVCVIPPANDSCADATPILVAVAQDGTTVNALNHYNAGLAGCTGFSMSGGDVAYELVLAAPTNITVTLSNVQAGFDPAIALLGPGDETVCEADPITACVAGADAGGDGANETFTYDATAGTYYILVDSFFSTDAGTFNLAVDVTTPTP